MIKENNQNEKEDRSLMPKIKKNILNILKIALAVGLIFYLVSSGNLNLHSIGTAIKIHPWWFFSTVILGGFLLLMVSLRWQMLLLAQEVDITLWKTLGLNFIGTFFSICLPGATGGDLVKCYYLVSLFPNKKTATITTVLIDRCLGLFGLILVGGVSILLNPSVCLSGSGNNVISTISYSILMICGGVIIIMLLLLNFPVSFFDTYPEKIINLPAGKMVLNLYQALRIYRDKQSVIYISLFLSMLVHTTIIIMTVIFGKIIGSGLSWRLYGVITPLGLIANGLPIAPAGLGVGEAAFEYLYKQVGSSFGGEIIALFHLVSIFWGILGLPFYLLAKKEPVKGPASEQANACAIDCK